jgi:hypothetical protein
VLYRPDEMQMHGNFHALSYPRILANSLWRRRLAKAHTSAHRRLPSRDADRCELDSCTSSDALLMNVFCYPGAISLLRPLLSLEADSGLEFGHRPRVPTLDGRLDCTELDLLAGDLMIEAKLTESDFQNAPWTRVLRYRDFLQVFDRRLLPGSDGSVYGYQLVRGILAAFAEETSRYCLICDARRTDLIAQWFAVVSAMRHHEQRWRCVLVTWQELSQRMPMPLRLWLQQKYGIAASGMSDETDMILRGLHDPHRNP